MSDLFSIFTVERKLKLETLQYLSNQLTLPVIT